MTINWKQVLEIESFMNNEFEKYPVLGRVVSRHPYDVNTSVRVNKNKQYSYEDLESYFLSKYPKDKLIGQDFFVKMALFETCTSGGKVFEIDEELLDINENQESYRLSQDNLRQNILNESMEFTGAASFFLYCLKFLIDSDNFSYLQIKDRHKLVEAIQSDYFTFINHFDNFNSKDFSVSLKNSGKTFQIPEDLHVTYKNLIEKTKHFMLDSRFTTFLKTTQKNNYDSPYAREDVELFVSDSLKFAVNEILEIINLETNNLFSFKLTPNKSPYPESLRINNYGNLNIFITLNGLLNFEKVKKIKSDGLFINHLYSILSAEYSILNKHHINPDYGEGTVSSGNSMNSSFVIGKNVTIKKLYNQHTDSMQDVVTLGTVWLHDDVHGLMYNYLGFNDKSDFVGEFEFSMPFENVIFKYLISYLEKVEFEWNDEELWQEDGYWITKDKYSESSLNELRDEDY